MLPQSAEKMESKVPTFCPGCRTHDKRKKAVYHTNVMLCVGTDVAIVCAEGVTDDKERQHLLSSLGAHQTVRTCVPIACLTPIRSAFPPVGLMDQ